MKNYYIITTHYKTGEKLYRSTKNEWGDKQSAAQFTQDSKEALGNNIDGLWEAVEVDLTETLEALIDTDGLAKLCETLDQVCIEKSNQVDKDTAGAWDMASSRLYALAKECRKMNLD